MEHCVESHVKCSEEGISLPRVCALLKAHYVLKCGAARARARANNHVRLHGLCITCNDDETDHVKVCADLNLGTCTFEQTR